jgi:hypothetical protein
MRYVVVKTRFRGMSPGFPPNFGGDYGKVTVIVFTALAWRLLKSHFSVVIPFAANGAPRKYLVKA